MELHELRGSGQGSAQRRHAKRADAARMNSYVSQRAKPLYMRCEGRDLTIVMQLDFAHGRIDWQTHRVPGERL